MGQAGNGQTRGVVAATRLEADEAVLDNVDTANTVVVAQLVEQLEDLNRAGRLLTVDSNLCGDTLLELNSELLRSGRGVDGVNGTGPQLLGRGVVGVLEHAGLVAAVDEVVVHGPGGLGAGRDGDVLLLGVLEQVLTTLELGDELGQPPWGNNLDGRVAGLEGELEADLVVALAGAAVADVLAVVLLGDADLGAGDDGAGQRGAQQVPVLVYGVALDGAEDDLLDKLLLQVEDHHLLSTKLLGLGLDLIPVLLLADIGEEADDGVALQVQSQCPRG